MALATHSSEIKRESKTAHSAMSLAPALATVGFLKNKAPDTPLHQIRTPLHGIATAIETLQGTCPTVFAKATEEEVELTSPLREIKEGLTTIEQGVEELKKITAPHAAADRRGETSLAHRIQFRAFTVVKVQEALLSLDTQVKLLQGVQNEVAATLAKRAELSSEALSRLLHTMAESTQKLLADIGLSTETLIKAAEKLNSTPEVKAADSSSPASRYRLGLCSPTPKLALVVDDNRVNQKALIRHLKRLSYQSVIANNGKEAVELAARGQYDIIFMDINMPIMDGFEATKFIRMRDKTTPIICVTANADQSHKTQADASGMNDFLAKPFSLLDIRGMLEKHTGFPTLSSLAPVSPESSPEPVSRLLSPMGTLTI